MGKKVKKSDKEVQEIIALEKKQKRYNILEIISVLTIAVVPVVTVLIVCSVNNWYKPSKQKEQQYVVYEGKDSINLVTHLDENGNLATNSNLLVWNNPIDGFNSWYDDFPTYMKKAFYNEDTDSFEFTDDQNHDTLFINQIIYNPLTDKETTSPYAVIENHYDKITNVFKDHMWELQYGVPGDENGGAIFANTKQEIMHVTVESMILETDIPTWQPKTEYERGKVVLWEGNAYFCTTTELGDQSILSPDLDINNWWLDNSKLPKWYTKDYQFCSSWFFLTIE